MFSAKEKKSLVVQSNELIEQPYRLTPKEHLLIRWFISRIQKDDTNFQVYRLKIADFMKILDIKSGSEYKYVKAYTQGLLSKGFTIKTDKGELQVNWFASAEYFDNEGIVEIEFSSKLKPYLLQLKECYTASPFGTYANMRCQHSFNLFDLLNRFMNTSNKKRRFTVEEFREKMSIEKNEYVLYGDLKKRVIVPSVKEINKYTYMLVEYEEEKVKTKVVAITFAFSRKEEIVEVNTNYDNLIAEISNKSNGIIILDIKTIKKILDVKGKDKLQYYIDNLDKLNYAKAGNPAGLFHDAVMNEYQLVSKVSVNSKSNRDNFEQREYDDEYFENFFDNTKTTKV
jgi:plasmid replication initiation protein